MKVDVVPVPGAERRVRLRFRVDAGHAEWLALPRAFIGTRPDGDYLEFDPPASYRGIQVKRGPYRPDELQVVTSQEPVLSDEVDLDDYYDLQDDMPVLVRYVGRLPLRGPAKPGGPFERVDSAWSKV